MANRRNTPRSRTLVLKKIINKQEGLRSYHENTMKDVTSRLERYSEVIGSMDREIEELRGLLEEDESRDEEGGSQENLCEVEMDGCRTHLLYSWLFNQIVCINETNPDSVAGDMLDLLKCSYYPVILLPMVDYNYSYEIPESFFHSRPQDFAEFIIEGRLLLSRFLSEVGSGFLTSESHWEEYSNRVHSWLVSWGFPLLYGATDEGWATTEPMPREEYFRIPDGDHGYIVTADSYVEKYRGSLSVDFTIISEYL